VAKVKETDQQCPSCKDRVLIVEDNICKNCKRFVNDECIKVGHKILYAPNRASMLRGITDNAYEDLGFQPGDIFTVKGFEFDDMGFKFVLVKENDIRFSPFELIPEAEISNKILEDLSNQYSELQNAGT
jgi:hypothetical protein